MADIDLTSSPDATPAPAIEGTPAPQAATPPAPSPVSATTDDRSTWVPPHRLRETREAAQREAQSQWAQREASIRAEADQWRSKAQALAGFAPAPDPAVSQVRSQFGGLYPGLSKIEERAEELLGILERQGDLESQNEHYWRSYGQQTMDRVFTKTAEALGGSLTDEGKKQLHNAFVGYVQSSPELTNRYPNDPSVVEEFVKAFTSNFIDPVRRATSATVQGRAATSLPQDTPSGAPRAAGAPALTGSLDDRANAAWNLYQQTHKS